MLLFPILPLRSLRSLVVTLHTHCLTSCSLKSLAPSTSPPKSQLLWLVAQIPSSSNVAARILLARVAVALVASSSRPVSPLDGVKGAFFSQAERSTGTNDGEDQREELCCWLDLKLLYTQREYEVGGPSPVAVSWSRRSVGTAAWSTTTTSPDRARPARAREAGGRPTRRRRQRTTAFLAALDPSISSAWWASPISPPLS